MYKVYESFIESKLNSWDIVIRIKFNGSYGSSFDSTHIYSNECGEYFIEESSNGAITSPSSPISKDSVLNYLNVAINAPVTHIKTDIKEITL